jgi:hypothetical protein
VPGHFRNECLEENVVSAAGIAYFAELALQDCTSAFHPA